MSRSLDDLVPEFRSRAETLIANAQARGAQMRPYATLRTPDEQARLWRQSRAIEEIELKIRELEDQDATYLASVIRDVGPQFGEEVTKAIPGLSWHQWGEALDCFWLVDGEAIWSTRKLIDGVNGYKLYAQEAADLGIDAGGFWRRFKDWPHAQLRDAGSPAGVFSLSEISARMERRFGP